MAFEYTGFVTLLLHFSGGTPSVIYLWIQANSRKTMFGVGITQENITPEQLISVIHMFFPEADVQEHDLASDDKPLYRKVGRFYLTKPTDYVTKSVKNFNSINDPLIYLTEVINGLHEDEKALFLIDIRHPKQPQKNTNRLNRFAQVLLEHLVTMEYVLPKEKAVDKRLELKFNEQLYLCDFFMSFTSPQKERLRSLNSMASTMPLYSDDIYPVFAQFFTSPEVFTDDVYQVEDLLYESLDNTSIYSYALTPDELASFWHPPHRGLTASKIERKSSKVNKNNVVAKVSDNESEESETYTLHHILRQLKENTSGSSSMNHLVNIAENSIFGLPQADFQYQCNVFMVMPFADKFRPVYDDHIKPTVEKLGYSIKRGDNFFSRRSIMTDVWSAMVNSDLIIADCTGRNPNVFYELGMAHTLDKPVIMITQNLDDIPFDIQHLRVILYGYTPRGMIEFENLLSDAIKKLLISDENTDESNSE